MTKTTLLLGSIATAAFMLAGGKLQAQDDVSTLTVTLTAMVQNEDSVRETATQRTTKYSFTTIKITNKEILKAMDAPSGSTLVLIDGELGYKKGNELNSSGIFVDIFSDFYVDVGQEVEVFDKSYKDGGTETAFSQIQVGEVGDIGDLNFRGLETSKYAYSEDLVRNTYSSSWTSQITGAGSASLLGEDAVISGKIATAGKQSGNL